MFLTYYRSFITFLTKIFRKLSLSYSKSKQQKAKLKGKKKKKLDV